MSADNIGMSVTLNKEARPTHPHECDEVCEYLGAVVGPRTTINGYSWLPLWDFYRHGRVGSPYEKLVGVTDQLDEQSFYVSSAMGEYMWAGLPGRWRSDAFIAALKSL